MITLLMIRTSSDNVERTSRLLEPNGSVSVSNIPRRMSSISDLSRCCTTSTSPLTRMVTSSRARGLVLV